MQISVEKRIPARRDNSCQLVFLFADGKLSGNARKINTESDGLIKSLFDSGDFIARHGQTLLLHHVKGCAAPRLLLAGLGKRNEITLDRWRSACRSAALAVQATPAEHLITDSNNSINQDSLNNAQLTEALVRELATANYRFSLHHLQSGTPAAKLGRITVCADGKSTDSVSAAADRALATAAGMATARDIGNLAPNICTPAYLADTALKLANEYERLNCEILDEADMEELGMGAFLSVSKGSVEPARLICMNYQGKRRAGSPIVIVGKGITFDTGGISIKPSEGLDEMKFDLCGAASVFGVIEAVARLQLPVNVVGLVAAAENMPDGGASRPGDVVVTMSGQSVEILNTDAEGRLVLCDTLTYAERYKPSVVIDVATLTGACVVALGKSRSGVMGNHQETVDELISAGELSGDLTWQLPLGDDYQSLLDSNFADMANIGGRPAGAITAGCFLSRFATKFSWAHLDIAGIASTGGKNKGATGRPVPLLMEFLFARAGK